MDTERWRQVEQLYHAALEQSPEMRAAFLESECHQDSDLRREVDSLLAQVENAGSFLEAPALQETATTTVRDALPGSRFGAYQILSPLGAGGMGEVYRAHDNKLGRDVAIKTLPRAFAGDPDRLARLRREARVLASLNHPNIAAIYGLEESGEADCLVLELVEGETLRGPLPVSVALDYARQISEALEAAHGKGIMHRDLKPSNVQVTPEGRVKVLDFGLAKAIWGERETRDLARLPAAALSETVAGQVLGTPPYMSPEQARGREVDKRTDIWAFGCLLYELLTGKQAFRGDTLADTIAAVLDREPDWQALPAPTPAKIRGLLRMCLQKDLARRPQEMADVRKEIEEALAAPRQRGLRRWQLATMAALGLAIFTIGAALWMRSPTRRADRSEWVQITNFPDAVGQPSLSPDGHMLTFVRGVSTFLAPGEVYVKMLPSGEPVQLTHDNLPKMSPVFSPDGSRIAYTVLDEGRNWDTWVVPVASGQPQLWLPNASGLVWTAPRRLLFSEIKAGEHMAIVAAAESRAEVRDVYVPPHERGMAHRSYVSPDGKWALVVEMDNAEWLPCRLVPLNGESAGRPVGPAGAPCTNAAWSPDGRWIYLSVHAADNFHIWRQRFPEGKPEPITSGPAEEEGIAPAADGRSLITSVGLRQRTVTVHNARGERQVSLEGYAYSPMFSPDGKKLYYRILKGGISPFLGASELWVADLDSGRNRLLLPDFAVTHFSLSRDGRRIVFSALDSGRKSRLWIASTDPGTAPRQVPNAEGDSAYFGRPGELIFHAVQGTSTFAFRIREDGTGQQELTSQQVNQVHGVSPDGQWAIGWGPLDGGLNTTQAYPMGGGPPMRIFGAICILRWQPDGKILYFSIATAMQSAGATGRTYVMPLPPGKMFPAIPAGGFHSEAEIAALSAGMVIEGADVAAGPTPNVYAFSRQTVQRNLYRIPIP